MEDYLDIMSEEDDEAEEKEFHYNVENWVTEVLKFLHFKEDTLRLDE